jgi:hypothetical protein
MHLLDRLTTILQELEGASVEEQDAAEAAMNACLDNIRAQRRADRIERSKATFMAAVNAS